MERSLETLSAIKALGYPGSSCLSVCRCDELPCPLLTWLSAELRTVCPELRDSDNTGDVLLVGELRDLLSNIQSPLAELASDVLDPSILSHVTEFLVSELTAAHINKHKELHPEENPEEESAKEQRVTNYQQSFQGCEDENASDAQINTAEMQAEWVLILHALGLDASSPFEDVQNELKSRLTRMPGGEMTAPLFTSSLTSEQWIQVNQMNQTMLTDYQCRRQMMIKRFQVTLESFAWGDKQKERRAALSSVPPLASLSESSKVSLPLLLATRQDQSMIKPVKAGTSTTVYKMLMGSVPDRGGRPGEIEPPMPMWGERRTQGNRWGKGNRHHHQPQKKKKGKKE
ncbi:Protein FAM98C [Oryzias melastigma]|uniref:Im:7138535 n=1 Tax=Oryzias melastigma TaxID=30732 RepID=A0A3B3CBG3_ORYME|nr:protein FAM98A [Oryzias melastigma]KAF6736013.1 Protein FAM98C [Oryzias melastigma]